MLKVEDFDKELKDGKVKSVKYNDFYYNFKLNSGHVTINNIRIAFKECHIGLGLNGVIHLDYNMIFNNNHQYDQVHDFITRVEEYKQGLHDKIV